MSEPIKLSDLGLTEAEMSTLIEGARKYTGAPDDEDTVPVDEHGREPGEWNGN